MSLRDVKPCGARTRIGTPCGQPGMRPSGRCRMHGGKTPRGLASPHLVHGRFSRDLPTHLLARFEEALADRDLLSLRQDVALLDALITEKLAEVRDEEVNLDLAPIADLVENIARHVTTWDCTRTKLELDRLQQVISSHQDQARGMREVRALIKEKAAVVAKENRRLAELNQHLTVEQAMVMIRALATSVRQHVMALPDGAATMKAIAGEWREALERHGN